MLLITFIGKGWVTVTVVVIIVLWLLLRTNAKREAIFLAIVNIGSSVWSPLFKSFFDRPRPTPDIVASITSPSSASFPSGHAMSAMVFYASLALLARHVSPRLYPFTIALAAFMIPTMGFTRMYLGVHYPTDVIAGWAWGAAWVSFAYWVYRRTVD